MVEYDVGQRIDGRYRVEKQLGRGGMGATYVATDESSGAEVVIKVPSLALIGDPAAFARFEREREIGERLDHPRLQKLLRAGQFAGGAPYLVMSYAPGVSLRQYLTERAPLSINESVRLAAQLANALAYCHEHGVVHRDVKPENLIRTPSGDLVLLDFGIASLKGARRITYSRLSNEIGTPDYMAPEQVRGERGSERTDVYAVGVLLYEMLTGTLPFSGDSALAAMNARLVQDAPSVKLRRSGVSWQLDTIVARALRRDPRERYATMAALHQDLMHLDRVGQADVDRSVRALWPIGRFAGAIRTAAIIALALAGLVLVGVLAQALHQSQLR